VREGGDLRLWGWSESLLVGSRMTTSLKRLLGRYICFWTAIESKNVKARDSSQADVKEKRWKEQTGVERRLIAFAMYSDEQPEQQENEAIKKLTMWRGPGLPL
jgi:hypothetical protein